MIHPVRQRKIIHIDMDAFFASVEQLDHPYLKGKPVAVGGGEERGVVAAASYEARAFGVRSAMPGRVAKEKCPQLIFVRPRFERYKEISEIIRDIFLGYTHLVEPLSLDEAFLDVTENRLEMPSATLIATRIREEIYQATGLTASAGISVNKFIAKIASDYNKPNGQKTVAPDEVDTFLADLAIHKFFGIGKVTANRMQQLGIFSGSDLRSKSEAFLTEHFGNQGLHYFKIARGIHESEVQPERIRKSLGAEETFPSNLTSEVHLLEPLGHLAAEVSKRLKRQNLKGKTVTLKLRYSDFSLHTRSKTLEAEIQEEERIKKVATELLFQDKLSNSVRLLGITISNFPSEEVEAAAPFKGKQLRLDLF